MTTALLGWELGGGFGHVTLLLRVASGLAHAGIRPILALKDLQETWPLLRDCSFPMLQAPLPPGPGFRPFRAASYADILAYRSYNDPDRLSASVAAWQGLLDVTGASLVVAEHSPTLCLAAYGALPVVVVGAGFMVPPATGENFPVLDPKAAPTVPAERLLASIQEVQRRRDRPAPATLPGLFGRASCWVCTYPEFDPYAAHRPAPACGPPDPPPPPLPPAEPGTFFAYLAADHLGAVEFLRALGESGLRGEVYLRGASAAHQAALERAGLEVHREPAVVRAALARNEVVIHHGGPAVGGEALACGRPQVLLPRHLEQELTATATERVGVGVMLRGRLPVAEMVRAVRERAPRLAEAARERAERISAEKRTGCLGPLIAECVALAARQTDGSEKRWTLPC